jgi:hypothetical protein
MARSISKRHAAPEHVWRFGLDPVADSDFGYSRSGGRLRFAISGDVGAVQSRRHCAQSI